MRDTFGNALKVLLAITLMLTAVRASAQTESKPEGIRIVPMLSSPSVHNGEALVISSLIHAPAGVREVLADVGGIETIRLERSPHASTANASLWSATWTGHSLEEKIYTLGIRVTDNAGRFHEDRSLQFSDPAAGISTAGTNDYSNGSMQRTGGFGLQGSLGEQNLTNAVIDTVNGYAYFGTNTRPGSVIKVALNGPDTPRKVSSLVLPIGEDFLETAAIDVAAGFAYFGTHTAPANIVKVALGAGDAAPTRVGTLTLNAGEDYTHCSLIDPASGYAWFGGGTNPGKVFKIALNGAGVPVRVGAATLNTNEAHCLSAVRDAATNTGYFGTEGTPASVVKVALGTGNAPPARLGAVKLNTGESNLWAATIDSTHGAAYFGTHTDSGQIIKIGLNGAVGAPTRLAALTLEAGEGFLHTAQIDIANAVAYFGAGSLNSVGTPSRVVKISIGGSAPTRLASLQLNEGEENLASSIFEPDRGYIYYGTNTPNGHVVRVSLSQRGIIKATRMNLAEDAELVSARLFSHAASGNVRLGIYKDGNPKTLVWESGVFANTLNSDVLVIPIAQGTPATLSLPAGNYWLAWQVDTLAKVPSFVAGGAANDGFMFSQAFGAFPASMSDGAITFTSEKWTEYIVYNRPGVPLGTNQPPVIGSAPTATPNPARVGEKVVLVASADDPDFDILSYAWTFGDGSNGSGASSTHVYAVGGTYTASVTVSDGNGGTASGSVAVVVNTPRVGGGTDGDGDGFSDSFEAAAGSDPNDVNSTPLGGAPASDSKPLSLGKMSIKLNFAKSSSDAIAVSGTLSVSAGFASAGQKVLVDVGGVLQSFSLDAKGGAKTGSDSIKIGIKGKKGVVAAQESKFAVKMMKGNFATALADEGFTGTANVKNETRTVKVTVLFDSSVFQVDRSLLYTAKTGKTGSAK